MSYIDKNLLPDERILFRTRKHLIIFFFPVIWILFSFYATYYMSNNPALASLKWIPWLMAFIFWIYYWLQYYTSEFVVTNKRVMMREGFFNRHTTELRLATISQVNVEQSLIGQMLNYGVVSINAFGAADAFTLIDQPFGFQKCVNEQLDKVSR